MFILGEVVGYISSALMGVSYDATAVSLFSAIIGTVGAVVEYYISKSAAPKPREH
ncbi:hypothetical protein IV50_GL000348 [Weissella viridescens]|uniref:Protein of uncharacterized function (DUF2929) n=2 Tax=Weissella viridescens TaxID=1629 RepID=A0A0R2H648_WEIVI|nr:hypothetical protein IV50_GL000348 [Weissella viridescens]SUP59329.1 Protein of uncharacterised function (DUF2929) [Weissella viridescens]